MLVFLPEDSFSPGFGYANGSFSARPLRTSSILKRAFFFHSKYASRVFFVYLFFFPLHFFGLSSSWKNYPRERKMYTDENKLGKFEFHIIPEHFQLRLCFRTEWIVIFIRLTAWFVLIRKLVRSLFIQKL